MLEPIDIGLFGIRDSFGNFKGCQLDEDEVAVLRGPSLERASRIKLIS